MGQQCVRVSRESAVELVFSEYQFWADSLFWMGSLLLWLSVSANADAPLWPFQIWPYLSGLSTFWNLL